MMIANISDIRYRIKRRCSSYSSKNLNVLLQDHKQKNKRVCYLLNIGYKKKKGLTSGEKYCVL